MKLSNHIRIRTVAAVVLFASLAMALPSDIPADAWKLKIRSVMSADTLVIETEKGLDEVWLVCARAPQIQLGEEMANEARNFVIQDLMGKEAWIVFDNPKNEPKRNRDGRYMAYVYYEKLVPSDSGGEPTLSFTLLNAELIARGLARVDLTFPCSKRVELNALQREARRQRLGIWAGLPE